MDMIDNETLMLPVASTSSMDAPDDESFQAMYDGSSSTVQLQQPPLLPEAMQFIPVVQDGNQFVYDHERGRAIASHQHQHQQYQQQHYQQPTTAPFSPYPTPTAAVDIPLGIVGPRSADAAYPGYHAQPGVFGSLNGRNQSVYASGYNGLSMMPHTYDGQIRTFNNSNVANGDSRFSSHSFEAPSAFSAPPLRTHIQPSELQPSRTPALMSARTPVAISSSSQQMMYSASPSPRQQRVYTASFIHDQQYEHEATPTQQQADGGQSRAPAPPTYTSRTPNPDSATTRDTASAGVHSEMDYETQRQHNIAANRRLMEQLGLHSDPAAPSASRRPGAKSRSPSKQQIAKRRSTSHLKTQYTRGGSSRVPSMRAVRSSGRLASKSRHISYAGASNDSDSYSDTADVNHSNSSFSDDDDEYEGGNARGKRNGRKRLQNARSVSGRGVGQTSSSYRPTLEQLLDDHPALPTTYPLFYHMLNPDMSVDNNAIPLIGSVGNMHSTIEKASRLQAFFHKAKRCVAQLDAFTARCDKKCEGPEEPWAPLDHNMKIAIRDVRRKAVERTENYKYTRRDLLNKALGYTQWEPIEHGMIRWTPYTGSTDPANDLVESITTMSTSPTTTTGSGVSNPHDRQPENGAAEASSHPTVTTIHRPSSNRRRATLGASASAWRGSNPGDVSEADTTPQQDQASNVLLNHDDLRVNRPPHASRAITVPSFSESKTSNGGFAIGNEPRFTTHNAWQSSTSHLPSSSPMMPPAASMAFSSSPSPMEMMAASIDESQMTLRGGSTSQDHQQHLAPRYQSHPQQHNMPYGWRQTSSSSSLTPSPSTPYLQATTAYPYTAAYTTAQQQQQQQQQQQYHQQLRRSEF